MSLVSILAPVYQGEEFIARFLDCVLNFDYKKLELILINDGSTDNTDKIIKSYVPKFEEQNIPLKYVLLPKNKGQAHTINVGLKLVEGEYLTWCDCDDIYFPNCISRCLEECKKDSEVKFVLAKSIVVEECNLNKCLRVIPKTNLNRKNLFEDYLFLKDSPFGPLRFCETKALFNVLINKTIYENKGGQNLQLFLPLLFNYKTKYIDEYMTKYVIRNSSHSRTFASLNRFKSNKDTIINTLKLIEMPNEKRNKYIKAIKHQYFKKKIKYLFNISINPKKKKFIFVLFGIGIRIKGVQNA